MAVVVASGAFLSFFTFATPLLIHSFSKKYVTKLYYNQVSCLYSVDLLLGCSARRSEKKKIYTRKKRYLIEISRHVENIQGIKIVRCGFGCV
jgi:hypothetical protein